MSGEEQLDPRWEGAFIGVEHWHFHRQLLQHHGIVLAPGEFSRVVIALKNGNATVIKRQSETRAVYLFRVRSAQERIYVVAEKARIITVLPPSKRLARLRRNLFAEQTAP